MVCAGHVQCTLYVCICRRVWRVLVYVGVYVDVYGWVYICVYLSFYIYIFIIVCILNVYNVNIDYIHLFNSIERDRAAVVVVVIVLVFLLFTYM